MRYLLDTHVVIWVAINSSALSKAATQTILSPENKLYISIASAWEVAIKVSKGNLRLDGGVSEFFNIIYQNGFELLPISKDQVKCLETLPFIHRDPFDRLLIATALTENLTIITADENIHKYDVQWIW